MFIITSLITFALVLAFLKPIFAVGFIVFSINFELFLWRKRLSVISGLYLFVFNYLELKWLIIRCWAWDILTRMALAPFLFMEKIYKVLGVAKLEIVNKYIYSPLLVNLAVLYKIRGKYENALSFAQRALTILRETVGANDHFSAECLALIGNIYFDQENYQAAIPFFQQAQDAMLASGKSKQADLEHFKRKEEVSKELSVFSAASGGSYRK
ncbi:MAG: tetratricopeptide repeat protein [Candidatus Omnitrophica bacterium]|nr:tetratricopeptide repeat protein [Candidatus Omnitrophota bacterium]